MKIYEVRTILKGQDPLLKNFVKVAQYRDRVLAEDRVKKDLKKKWAKKGGYENFGQDEIRKLEDEYDYHSMVYGTPEQRKAAKLIDGLDQWAMDYVGEALRPDQLEHLSKEIANHKQWDNFEPTDKEVMDAIKKDTVFGKDLLKYASSQQKKEAVKIIQDYLAESTSVNEEDDTFSTRLGPITRREQQEMTLPKQTQTNCRESTIIVV